MSTTTLIIALLTAVALGQSLLSALILWPRVRPSSIYLPLVLFFIVNSLVELSELAMLPPFFIVAPLLSGLAGFTAIPFYCVLAPLFWIYVRGLTSEMSIIWAKHDVWHFAFGIISVLLPITVLLMPASDFLELFAPGSDGNARDITQTVLIIATKTIDILIILQIGFYITLIVRRLADYRSKLTQLFASTEHLELRWFRWLALFMLAYLLLSALSLLADSMFRSPHSIAVWESLIDVGLITTLCVWGLRQQASLAIESEAITADNQKMQKYQHSAFSDEQCKALATKIEHAMATDKLYRKDDLSLRVLAKHVGDLPSYVTQTLNTQIGESFFDYVNRWRIQDAVKQLSDSDQTVLAIATDVGFNSRSSFYNAFKRIKGTTPTAYRKTYYKGQKSVP